MNNLFQNITFQNKSFIIMRDDLSHPILSGNKARKLQYILDDNENFIYITKIVSFGGNQSNFMLALSQLAKFKNWQFEYWVKTLPKFLKKNQLGNLKQALANGMTLYETTENLNINNIKQQYSDINNIYFFDQGGRDTNAEVGLKNCADEILKYANNHNISEYSVVVASGTGTTALYLEKYLTNKIYTISCIGSDEYLINQMQSINSKLKPPAILLKPFDYKFGYLDIENFNIQKELYDDTNIKFDLLYDPIAWRVMLKEYDRLPKPIIYIHCGGITGNETMLNRYRRYIRLK